jgi:NitT/TauT family transport system substrate-binding protein
MKIQQLTWAKASLAAIVALGLTGCGGSNTSGGTTASGTASSNAGNASTQDTSATAAGPSEIKKVTIGYLPNIVMPQPLLGLTNGEYAKRVPGVEFAGKDYPAGPAVMEALRGGVVDIAYTGPYPPIKA